MREKPEIFSDFLTNGAARPRLWVHRVLCTVQCPQGAAGPDRGPLAHSRHWILLQSLVCALG